MTGPLPTEVKRVVAKGLCEFETDLGLAPECPWFETQPFFTAPFQVLALHLVVTTLFVCDLCPLCPSVFKDKNSRGCLCLFPSLQGLGALASFSP